jgi:hypothetical protein
MPLELQAKEVDSANIRKFHATLAIKFRHHEVITISLQLSASRGGGKIHIYPPLDFWNENIEKN